MHRSRDSITLYCFSPILDVWCVYVDAAANEVSALAMCEFLQHGECRLGSHTAEVSSIELGGMRKISD